MQNLLTPDTANALLIETATLYSMFSHIQQICSKLTTQYIFYTYNRHAILSPSHVQQIRNTVTSPMILLTFSAAVLRPDSDLRAGGGC